MTCRELDASLDDYLDDALPGPARRAVSVHLVHCPPCRRAVLAYADTIVLARGAFADDAPPPLPESVTRAILAALPAIPAH